MKEHELYNYKLVLQYEGIRYNGWQKQKNQENTIQEVVENAVFDGTGERAEVIGSGRTDAGTHAMGQVANVKLGQDLEPERLMDNINKHLPSDIKILECEKVDNRFHARLNAKAKTYMYTLCVGKKPDVFNRRTVLHYCADLDVDAMKKAAEYLKGEHDFMSFCSNKRTKKSTVRKIYDIEIIKDGDEISFIFKGNGFLYNKVRILTGTLVEVGLGKTNPEDMPKILEAKDRSKSGATLPPRGLILVNVEY